MTRVIPRVLFTIKSFINETGRSQGHIQKKALKGVCTLVIVLSLNTLTPTPSTSSAMKIPENKK